MPTRQEILSKTREKYPQYAEVDDDKLAASLSAKYPSYAQDLQAEPSPIAEQEAFKAKYKADQAKGPIDRGIGLIKSVGSNAFDLARSGVMSPINLVKGGAEIMGKASTTDHPILNTLKDSTLSSIEGGRRIGYDILNALRNPPKILQLSLAGPALSPVLALVDALKPKKVTDEEAQKAFEKSQVDKAYSEGRTNTDQNPNINESYAQGVSDLPNALAAGQLAKGAIGLAKSAGAIPTVESRVQAAIKPQASKAFGFKKELGRAIPELQKAGTINSFEDAINVGQKARQNVWAEVQQKLGDNSALTIDGSKISQEIEKIANHPKIVREMTADPSIASMRDKLLEKAKTYNGQIPVQEAEAILEETNKITSSYFNKNPASQRVALSEPEFAAEKSIGDNIRSQLDQVMEKSATGKDFSELKRRYGALKKVDQQIQRRAGLEANKTENPTGLMRGIGGAIREGLNLKFGNAAMELGKGVASPYLERALSSEQRLVRALKAAKANPRQIPLEDTSRVLAVKKTTDEE